MFVKPLLCSSHLRYDTLAQMLTLGNIHAGNKMIVMETCAGLVLGAVMERMGGELHLSHAHTKGHGNTHLWDTAKRQRYKMLPQLLKSALTTSKMQGKTCFSTGESFCISWTYFSVLKKKTVKF